MNVSKLVMGLLFICVLLEVFVICWNKLGCPEWSRQVTDPNGKPYCIKKHIKYAQ